MDSRQLIDDGLQLATKAVNADQAGQYKVAIFFYVEASEAILKAVAIDPDCAGARGKAEQYVLRAEVLQEELRKGEKHLQRSISQTETQKEIQKIEFLLRQALAEDEGGRKQEAAQVYVDAVELCLQTAKTVNDDTAKEKINRWAKSALERAEVLKGINSQQDANRVPASSRNIPSAISHLSGSFRTLKVSQDTAKRPKLTPSEIEVLRKTSYINNKTYLPWLDSDLNERFAYPIPWSDPDGKMVLAPKQKAKFAQWVRPSDLCEDPRMIYAVSSFSVRQTVISDCSFVASLAISAAYEREFKQRLITSIIYPQNREGKPIINPCGKYMVKLKVNGVARKVLIDDTLPVDENNRLLCSYSDNSDEFWVSLLEKAYMKVMGGYDFPGSNSNIDLHTLTGWIPERASLKNDEINRDVLFRRMKDGLKRGDVLITAATGFLSDEEADRAGLVPTHAYAVLQVREVKGLKLVQMKNPWSHLRWKGKFSENDVSSWTLDLEKELRYDRLKAKQQDNGVFWINWESLIYFFDVVYMNWNPKLFAFKFSLHAKWEAREGPVKDAYNIGDNPQYRLEVHCGNEEGVVWIQLTRHITDREDFAENKEFITVHVYKSNGDRIYYPGKPYLEGTKINSPHYVSKMRPPKGVSKYTLVVSQYEKLNTILYSLKVYGTVKFHLAPVAEPYTSRKKVTGQWTAATAGGCTNFPTYSKNPKYLLELIADHPSSVLIKLQVNKTFAAGIELVSVNGGYRKTSGDFRYGFIAFEMEDVPPGKYKVIPATFSPGQEGPFFLEIAASCAFKLDPLSN